MTTVHATDHATEPTGHATGPAAGAPAPAADRGGHLVVALRATLVTLVLTGLAYPLVVTALAQLVFPERANGSLAVDDAGRVVGSRLLGQAFTQPGYLHGRPSATGYDAASSGGTNLAVTSRKLRDGQPDDPTTPDVDEAFVGARALAAAFRADNGLPADAIVPADAVTRSASGLDPDVSPATAALQAARIARARGYINAADHDAVEAALDRVRAMLWRLTH